MTVDTAKPAGHTATHLRDLAGKMEEVTMESVSSPANHSKIDIIDIRREAVEIDLKLEITSLLKPEKGPKKLPTLLLYDEQGLQMFEKVGVFSSRLLARKTYNH